MSTDSNNNSNNNNNDTAVFNNKIYQDICSCIKDVLEKNGDEWVFNKPDQTTVTFKHLLLDETVIDDDLKLKFFDDSPTDAVFNLFNYDNPQYYFTRLNENKFYYPPKPFYKHLSILFMSWNQCKQFPIKFDSLDGLFEVDKSEQEKDNIIAQPDINSNSNGNSGNNAINPITYFRNMNEQVFNFFANLENNENKALFFNEFFKNLNNRNLLTLFNVRKTKLSLDTYFLECPIDLIKHANQLHAPKSKSLLTVASRALCKHGIRSENSFWGSDKGPEMVKNKRAEKVLVKVLSDSFWINIHLLPHNIPIIEIRNSQGYGLRWSATGDFFRGFLEPQMEDGHEKGWKH
ncbi:hypothetical protein CYY_000090 [Polysphondylium violaceum]|uniref:Uncharacterized protein n=1 Tax=Polysphondylium violaceum TaxID=133409 RepID=A0A8J4Q3G6_9MYCE|nr:hypothetical protein CYY_000090 [Polysphondylium violaceum]